MRDICEMDDPAGYVASAKGVIGGARRHRRKQLRGGPARGRPSLLSPIDLQAVKAAGVTFVVSLLERVIEEQARGAAERARRNPRRHRLADRPRSLQAEAGFDEAMEIKAKLIARGVWSQYLEVGIGPDAEIFTKCQPMASVGFGADVGLHPISNWNNPEPEVAVVASSEGKIVGAALGNDVNLRDVEGRSALLLGKAKDNNASAALGPFIRLFDASFSHRRREAAKVSPEGRGRGRLPAGGRELDGRDQPLAGGAGRCGNGRPSPVSGRPRALSRHHVRAVQGSRRERQGLHPQARRHRHHLDRTSSARSSIACGSRPTARTGLMAQATSCETSRRPNSSD